MSAGSDNLGNDTAKVTLSLNTSNCSDNGQKRPKPTHQIKTPHASLSSWNPEKGLPET